MPKAAAWLYLGLIPRKQCDFLPGCSRTASPVEHLSAIFFTLFYLFFIFLYPLPPPRSCRLTCKPYEFNSLKGRQQCLPTTLPPRSCVKCQWVGICKSLRVKVGGTGRWVRREKHQGNGLSLVLRIHMLKGDN